MRRILYLFAFLLGISVGLTAQNYQMVNSAVTTTFIGNDNQQVESIRIDSSFVEQGDSIFYPFYNIQQADYDCFLPFSYSWIGKKIIIKTDGYNCFINREDDTVKINTLAQLNENWIAYEGTDTIIIAEVIKHDTLSFLGQVDSAKTISFTAYNKNMESISHPVNDMTIIISENYGMLKTMNFSLFSKNIIPYYGLQTYDLIGMSSPPIGIVNLTWREIYDFDIGDEIHIIDRKSISGYVRQEIKYIYLDKTVSANSVDYKVDRNVKISNWVNNKEKIEYVHDTIIMYYNYNSYLVLSGEPVGDEEYLMEMRLGIGDIPKKTITLGICRFDWGESDCWMYCLPFCQYGGTPRRDYLKGLGGPYYYCDQMGGYQDSRSLLYYKKGDITWGTPLSMNDLGDYNDLVKIYPNPAIDYLYIEINNEEYIKGTLQIMTIVGQVVYSNILTSNKEIIPVGHLSAGLYIVQYSLNNQIINFKFIKH